MNENAECICNSRTEVPLNTNMPRTRRDSNKCRYVHGVNKGRSQILASTTEESIGAEAD